MHRDSSDRVIDLCLIVEELDGKDDDEAGDKAYEEGANRTSGNLKREDSGFRLPVLNGILIAGGRDDLQSDTQRL